MHYLLEDIILELQIKNTDPCTTDADIRFFETEEFNSDGIKLIKHIKAFNALPINVDYGITESIELEYWYDLQIHNIKQFEFYQTQQDAYNTISEAFSKSYARLVCFGEGVTMESVTLEAKTASEYLKRTLQEEDNQEAKIFAEVNSLAKQCNVSHETMERWLAQAI